MQERMWRKEASCTVGGSASWCNHSDNVWRGLRKLKIGSVYDPAVPLPGQSPDKTLIQKDTCTLRPQ